MVGVFRRWLGVTTLRKIKAEWRKTDVWCTISSPWYVDVVVPQIHRTWRHLATNSWTTNIFSESNLMWKRHELKVAHPHHIHHILWTSGQVRDFFLLQNPGTLLASAQSHPLVRILDSAKKVTEVMWATSSQTFIQWLSIVLIGS